MINIVLFVYLKGKFKITSDDSDTESEKQTPKLSDKFYAIDFDRINRCIGDEIVICVN